MRNTVRLDSDNLVPRRADSDRRRGSLLLSLLRPCHCGRDGFKVLLCKRRYISSNLISGFQGNIRTRQYNALAGVSYAWRELVLQGPCEQAEHTARTNTSGWSVKVACVPWEHEDGVQFPASRLILVCMTYCSRNKILEKTGGKQLCLPTPYTNTSTTYRLR